METLKVVVTGGTGQIAYNFLFSLGIGEVFGDSYLIDLRVYDIPGTEKGLSGIKMELDDCAFPLLSKISYYTSLEDAFDEINVAFLIGALPRGPGMERSDLLLANGKIFKAQGAALNRCANPDAKIFVVGNPANTNCLIAMEHAPDLKRANFHSMMRLDQNRMQSMLAHKVGVPVDDVKQCIVWGNHSARQVPDFTQVVIGKDCLSASQLIGDRDWMENVMVPTVQKRGASVIEARGKSSAGSASRALGAAAKSLFVPQAGEWFTSGVCSDGNFYGISQGLIFGFPCRATGNGGYEILKDIVWDDFIESGIMLSQEELLEERIAIQSLLS
ncbi:MAG: malate dehydrogenase [Victivallaceae bacterium]